MVSLALLALLLEFLLPSELLYIFADLLCMSAEGFPSIVGFL